RFELRAATRDRRCRASPARPVARLQERSIIGVFRKEPLHAHDRSSKIGVLLVNLGTPDAPTAAAVRRYLAEFLSDRRVVEIPAPVWKPILHGIVLRVRPARSAQKYAMIWGSGGSPLLVHSVKQRSMLAG